ncbi:MAG: Holliday junction branch migration DNA helicase RuvB [Planctomycetota bacterium]|nr:MAG: Holliday junction branch migration DNA helicase RuvB [Planctomycetota bacterium]
MSPPVESQPDHVFDPAALTGLSGDPAGAEQRPEAELEAGLRPRSLAEFVGQPRVIENLRVALGAARRRGEPPDHILFSGPPGLGKTSLARIMASELGSRLQSTSGPAVDRPRDLVGILTQLEPGDVLFIDEIHRIPSAVEEYLYTAMEDFSVDLTLDSGPHARVMTLALKPFTLVGATTREGLLSAPFRARFGLFERLDPYPAADLVRIVTRASGILGIGLHPEGAQVLADRSRGTPRIVNRFLRRARDLAEVRGETEIDRALALETLERLGIDAEGLEEMDRRILRCLAQSGGEPTGIKTIAAAVGEAEDTIEEVFEPHLLRCGHMRKTARGRVITDSGRSVIGMDEEPRSPAGHGLFG